MHTGLFSYKGLPKLGYQHRPRKVASVPDGEHLLLRVHRAISNLKAWMHGTHRSVSNEHLPVYLDEYVRHEALSDRVGCKTLPLGRRSVLVKLRAA